MSTIDQELSQIRTAVYGDDMRTAIYNAMLKVNSEFVSMKNKINNQDATIEEYSADLSNRIIEVQNIAESKADDMYYDEDNNLLYLKSQDEIISNGVAVAGSGGGEGGGGSGGGSGGSSSVDWNVRNTNLWTAKTITKDEECPVTFNWYSLEDGVPTGGGILSISISGVTKATIPIDQGDVTVDVAPYLNSGSNSLIFLVMDTYGNRKSLRYAVTLVELRLESSFDSSAPFTGAISFPYTALASTVKTIYFFIDGNQEDVITTSSTNQRTFVIPQQSHGAHSLRCYYEVELNGQTVRSNELYYEFISIEPGNISPIIISSFSKTTCKQYDTLNIGYTVYNPTAIETAIAIKVNNVVRSNLTVDQSAQVFAFQAETAGALTIEFVTGTPGSSDYAHKVISLTVQQSDADIGAVESGLELYMTSKGRSNNESDRSLWVDSDHNVSATLTDFNWRINGWLQDSDGVTVLRVSDDARVSIPFKIFENDFKANGKTIEVEFATREVVDYSAVIFSCYADGIGLRITPQMVYFNGAQTGLTAPYKDNEHVRLSIVVGRQNNYRLIQIYINGIMSGAIQYASGERFSQLTPVNISIGSNDCSIDIYNIRVYDTALSSKDVLANWIADTQVGTLMIDRYSRNNIYSPDTGDITIDTLPSDLPYFIIEAEELPQYKGDKKTVTGSYVDPLNSSKSFRFEGCQINVQGTSSAPYYRKNYDMQFKMGFILNSGLSSTYALKNGSIPFNRFVLKADVASSESTNNTGLVSFYNDTCPYKVPEMVDNPKVRWGIEGVPIVVFWYNPNTGVTELLGKYNFNLPKRCPEPLGYSGNYESWEVERNNSLNVKFQDDDFDTQAWSEVDQQYYPEWYDDFEARFPSDEWRDYSKIKEFISFVKSTNRADATGTSLTQNVTYRVNSTVTLTAYGNDNSYTVVDEKDSHNNNTGYKLITFTKDTPAYRLTKFRSEFPDYAEVQSFCYYYLFTEEFLMIDSRAKNMFIGFHGSVVTSGNIQYIDRKAVAEPYDMDTAIGTNNSGVLMFTYSLEDTDTVDSVISGAGGGSNAPVFNAQDSVLWTNFRDAFAPERTTMYRELRASGAWSYNAVETMYENHQSKWPEALFNKDAEIKYLVPLTNPVTVDEDTGELIRTDRYLTMLQGSKEQQRKWWLYNRFRFTDSKYATGDASSKIISLRVFNSGTLILKTAIDMYAGVSFGGGTTVSLKRTPANTAVSFPYTSQSGVTEMETWIYSADMITDVGDLSGLYPNELDFSKATRLQNLKIGDSTNGYSNANLRALDVRNCAMLETIDVRNCPNLAITVNLEGSPRLKEAYFEGTAITGVDLVDGCIIETLHLPATITALTLLNLNKLTHLSIASFSHITRLMLANMDTSVIDPVTVLGQIPANAQVNIQGIAMEAANAAEIETFFALLDNFRGVSREKSSDGEWMYHDYDTAQVSGTIHTGTLTGAQLASYNERYPYIRVTADHISCTLTFKQDDDSTTFGTQSVSDGGNGSYTGSTPTKSSTAQYTYTFVGWSKSMNAQTADSDALTNVTMDRTVYAAYSRTTRTYTATFKNDDNSTTLYTQNNVPYGTTPTYGGSTPTSTDASMGSFQGWTPALGPITGNTTYVATYQSPVQDAEISDTWDTILSNLETGALSSYKVGNYKSMDVGSSGSEGPVDMQIVGFDVDSTADGGTAEVTMVAKQILKTTKQMNTSGTNANGYPATNVMKPYMTTLLATLPANIQKHITAVAKTSYDKTTSADLTTYEKLWILSAREVFGGSSYEQSGPVYNSIYKDAASRIKYPVGSSSAYYWWLRSADSNNTAGFRRVYSSGDVGYNVASFTYGVVLGFSLSAASIRESLSTISGAISDGTYTSKYAVGDTILIDFGDQGKIPMQIAGFNVDTDQNGNTIPITLVAKVALATTKAMNSSGTNANGYPVTNVMKPYMETLYNNLPSTLKSMIVPATKTSYDKTTSADLTTYEKLWIPSAREVFGGSSYEQSGPVYSSIFPDANSRKRIPYGSSSAYSWWLRSAYSSSTTNFRSVSYNGDVYSNDANSTGGVVLGFCIGAAS